MKKISKRILFSVIIFLISFSFKNIDVVNAITKFNVNDKLEIYEVKMVSSYNTFIDYYENDPNKEAFMEYQRQQERLKQEEIARIELKNNLVEFAMMFIGNPYVSGGTSLTNGADCSGFVQSVYKNFDYYLPRTTVEQSLVGDSVSYEEIEVGDIVSYGYNGVATHSAIYIGEGKIIHSSTPELGIRVDNLNIIPIVSFRKII